MGKVTDFLKRRGVYCILSTHTHTHTYRIEHYSAIKKNEIMPSAATWMDLEIIILGEIS